MPKAPRIFVVEDDESIRMLLEVALRSSGYTVSAFPNAADALAEMENTVPDAAVLDIMLDGMDGITALKLMRANARLAGVPVQNRSACWSCAPVCARCCGAAAPRPRRKRAAC